MNNTIDKVEGSYTYNIDWHNKMIEHYQSVYDAATKLAHHCDDNDIPVQSATLDGFHIECSSLEEARQTITKLLEFGVSLFDKEIDAHSVDLAWRYRGNYKGLSITVQPCEQVKECLPVRESYNTSYWVCKRKEGDE